MPVYYTIFCGKRQEVFLMRGRQPLRTPFFSLPPRRGFAGAGAPAPPDAGAPPCTRGSFLRDGSPCTHQWAYPAHTRGSFRFTTKGTKGVPGLPPLDPLGGHYHPPNGARAVPPRKGLSLQPRPICHFKFVGESVFFSPSISARAHLLVSGRGAAGCWTQITEVADRVRSFLTH